MSQRSVVPPLRRLLPVLAFGGSAVLMAACGSSGSGSSGGSDNSLVVQRSANSGYEPAVIAAEKGYFKEQGLDVQLKIASNDITKNVPLVVSGQVDISMSSPGSIVAARSQGVPVTTVLGIQSASNTSKDDGCLVPPGSKLRSAKELVGKTVGIPNIGNPVQLVNNIAMRRAGADPKAVKYVVVSVDALNAAGRSGQVQAICTFGQFHGQALKQGYRPLAGSMHDIVPGLSQVLWMAKSDFAKRNPEQLEKFTAAMKRAYDYLNANPAEFRRVTRDNSELPDDYINTRPLPVLDAGISRGAFLELAKGMNLDGLAKNVPAASDLVEPGVPELR